MADGYLTTHILDTARGCPAAGVSIELFRVDGSERHRLSQKITNADGRTDGPILEARAFAPGTYELIFYAGRYLREVDPDLPDPLFLDEIPIRFALSDPGAHYHVPLLLSPFGYSTYRGS